jgi:hypothetical protein
MTASTDAEVFNFEGNLEKSFADYLTDEGLTIATSNSPATLPSDFVAVSVTISGVHEDEHMSQRPYYGNLEYDHYKGSVAITVHSDRVQDTPPSIGFLRYHKELVSKARAALSIMRAYDDGGLNSYVEYYAINRLIPAGADYESDDMQYDETTLTFDLDFTILTKAWPIG